MSRFGHFADKVDHCIEAHTVLFTTTAADLEPHREQFHQARLAIIQDYHRLLSEYNDVLGLTKISRRRETSKTTFVASSLITIALILNLSLWFSSGTYLIHPLLATVLLSASCPWTLFAAWLLRPQDSDTANPNQS